MPQLCRVSLALNASLSFLIHFVAGELERRLRKFGKAQIRFTSLADDADIQSSRFSVILESQQKLINAKNSRSHKI